MFLDTINLSLRSACRNGRKSWTIPPKRPRLSNRNTTILKIVLC